MTSFLNKICVKIYVTFVDAVLTKINEERILKCLIG